MISSELSSMQEILSNLIYPYDISNEFLNWMKYKRYRELDTRKPFLRKIVTKFQD